LEFTHVQELGQHCQECRQSCMRARSQVGSSQVLGLRFMVQLGCPKPCPTSARVLKHPKLEPQAKVLLGDTTPRFCVGNPFQPLYVFTYRQDFLPQSAGAHGGETCSTQFSGIGSGTSGGGCSRFRRSSAKQLFQELADL
jgi:hypothetical protein